MRKRERGERDKPSVKQAVKETVRERERARVRTGERDEKIGIN